MKRLQVRTIRDHHVEGVDLASDEEEGLNRDNRANLLHDKEAKQPPPLGRFYDQFDSEAATRVSGAAETVDYFG